MVDGTNLSFGQKWFSLPNSNAKAGHHLHGDTLPLLAPVYRSTYSFRRTFCKQKTYPNPFS